MGVFLWLSDLHLDPLYGTALAARHGGDNPDCSLVDNVNATILEHPYGRVGCDSPLSLVESALHSAVLTSVNYKHSILETTDIDFVLVTGDFIRHQLGALLDSSSSSSNIGIDVDIDIDPIEYAQTILSTCINSIQTILPGVPVLPVLGNNDVFPDYYLDTDFCSGQELDEEDENNNNTTSTTNDTDKNKNNNVLAMVRNGLKDAFLSEEEASTFANGGYFSRLVELPSSESSILVLSLNTILYSPNHAPDCYYNSFVDEERSREDDPLGQFAWMESQLRRAAEGGDAATTTSTSTIVGVYLAGHIPPSIGSYRHSQLWRDQYLERYFSILNDYSLGRYNSNHHHPAGSSTNPNIGSHQLPPPPPPILGHFFGHVHTEEFRLLAYGFGDKHNHDYETNATDGGANDNETTTANANENESAPMVVPLLFASSITPIYGSNPSYRIVQYDDGSGALLDYQTHYLDLGQWNSSSSSSISDTGTGNSTSSSSSNNNNTLPSTPNHETPIWTELPGFLEAYGVPDLSPESFESIFANLEEECRTADTTTATTTTNTPSSTTTTTTTTNRLWETFWNRQNLYSSAPDNDDDIGDSNMELMIDWLCTMRASSKEDYERCLDVRMNSEHPCGVGGGDDDAASAAASSGITVVILIAANVAAMLGVVVWFWGSIRRKRAKRRTMYLQMSLEKESEEHEIEFNCEYDDDHGDGKEANLSPEGVNTQTAEHCMPTPEGIDDRQGTILSRELV